MNVLVVDIGGTNVKILASGQAEPRKFPSGPKLTPKQMVAGVKQAAGDWKYDVVSIGYPGRLHRGRIVSEPHNLGPGWLGFDFEAAFKCPVKLMNDAAMQALGSYKGGYIAFCRSGNRSRFRPGGGRHTVVPMELGHLSYQKETYEDHVGLRGLKRLGKKKWTQHVARGVKRLLEAFHPDDVVLGGGNAKKLKKVPPGCRIGNNANAFLGGFRLWDGTTSRDIARPVDHEEETKGASG